MEFEPFILETIAGLIGASRNEATCLGPGSLRSAGDRFPGDSDGFLAHPAAFATMLDEVLRGE
jgi:hypothetical protein